MVQQTHHYYHSPLFQLEGDTLYVCSPGHHCWRILLVQGLECGTDVRVLAFLQCQRFEAFPSYT